MYNLLNKFLSDISAYSYIPVQLRQPYELVETTQNFLQCLPQEKKFGIPVNKSPFTSYTIVTPHSNSRSDFPACMMSRFLCIKLLGVLSVLRANNTRLTHEYKAGESVPSYSQLIN